MAEFLINPSGRQALAAVEHATNRLVAAEIAQAVALAEAADTYRVGEGALLAGVEELRRGGADGTTRVSEFLACEIGALLGMSPASAAVKIADVLNVRDRHPRLWEAVLQGRVRFWQASQAASKVASAGLDGAAAEWVDRQLAAAASVKPWNRVLADVDRLILVADPELAAERAREAAERRHVAVGDIVDGHCDVWGRLDAADAIALDQALDAAADAMGDIDLPKAQRRAVALGDLARGAFGQQPLPVELVVRLESPQADVASVEGRGHVLRAQLADLLSGCRVTIRPVVVEQALPSFDGYRIPDVLRLVVCERNPVDVFPYGTLTSRKCDVDHTIPYDFTTKTAGQTRATNLGPLSRRAHRAKTHAGWQVEQTRPGVFVWESPAGYRYRVDANGTRKLNLRRETDTARGNSRPGGPPPTSPSKIETAMLARALNAAERRIRHRNQTEAVDSEAAFRRRAKPTRGQGSTPPSRLEGGAQSPPGAPQGASPGNVPPPY